jgi:hypothetical protein
MAWPAAASTPTEDGAEAWGAAGARDGPMAGSQDRRFRPWASLIRVENRLALIYSCSQVIAKLTGNAWGTRAIRRMNSIKTAG